MFLRPHIIRPLTMSRPAARRLPQSYLSGLGDLGDVLQGSQAAAELTAQIKSNIIDRQGPMALGAGLQNALWVAKNTFKNGLTGSLAVTFQPNWDKWRAAAQPGDSAQNIFWVFGQSVATWADRLIDTANAQPALLNDPSVTKVSYTLVDTTQSGTTWYGGTVTSSKLTNPQWAQVFTKAWNVLCTGITAGVLPFSYLTVLCKAMLAEPTMRRFPTFHPTDGDAQSAGSIAWRAAMKQLGWNDVVQMWFGFTQQAWAAENARADQMDAVHAAAITGLNYLSGKAIFDQLHAKVQSMAQERTAALQNMAKVEQVLEGPLRTYVPVNALKQWEIVKRDFADAEAESNRLFGPAGLWPAPTSGLGVVTLIIAGTVGVTLLGMSVWLLALWTNVSRTAAAQAKQISDSVLATVGEVRASCVRTYESSGKTAEDEQALQACLMQSDTLIKSIPVVKTGGGGMGLVLAGLAAAVGGFLLWSKRK